MRKIWLILALSLVCATTVSVALAARGKAPAKPDRAGAAVVHVRSSPAAHTGVKSPAAAKQDNPAEPNASDPDNVQQGDQATPDNTGAESGAADTGNVQQGDQAAPDNPGEQAGSESEQASESGPSDGPGGYADTNPNADTQQQGEH